MHHTTPLHPELSCNHLLESGRFVYVRGCVCCAARLVIASRPSRKRQEAMLAYIEKYYAIDKEDVLREVRRVSYNATQDNNTGS